MAKSKDSENKNKTLVIGIRNRVQFQGKALTISPINIFFGDGVWQTLALDHSDGFIKQFQLDKLEPNW